MKKQDAIRLGFFFTGWALLEVGAFLIYRPSALVIAGVVLILAARAKG